MNNKNNYHYIQFPLCLLQETYNDTESGFNIILEYGLVRYGLRLVYTPEAIQRQLIYDYVRNIKRLQPFVIKKLNEYCLKDKLNIPDTDGFDLDGYFNMSLFQLDKELSHLFSCDYDLAQTAILNYRIHMSSKLLNIKIASYDKVLNGYQIANSIKSDFEKRHGNDAMPMCKPEMLLSFRDKNPYEAYLFRAYIGIRSLIGRKDFTSTHKSTVLMRMLGCKNNEALNLALNSNKQAAEEYEKYSNRKRIDKLFRELMERKFAQILSWKGERQIYVSVKYPNLNEFAEAIIEKKQEKNIKKQLYEARARITGHLYNETS